MAKAYCDTCGELVDFVVENRILKEKFKDEDIEYKFAVGICKACGSEVCTDIDYITRKSHAKFDAYIIKHKLLTHEELCTAILKASMYNSVLFEPYYLDRAIGFKPGYSKLLLDRMIPTEDDTNKVRKFLHDKD